MSLSIRNAGGVPFLALEGRFVVRPGQMPDGDTLSFAAGKPYQARAVTTNVPVDPTGSKTVNIRLQSIDAPEKAQPWGAKSRDSLLQRFGFDPAALGLGEEDFTANGVLAAKRGWLATHGLDRNKRPLGYLFWEDVGLKHGQEVPASALLPLMKKTANFYQIKRGAACPAFYENTDEAHALVFQAAAVRARAARKGVWAHDRTTTGFTPTPEALGMKGALVYPKFFRRVENWKAAKPNAAGFIKWLKSQSDGRKLVTGAARDPLPLWRLFEVVDSGRVAVPYDVTKLWFSE